MNSEYNQKFDIFTKFLADNGLQYNPIEHDILDIDVCRKKHEVSNTTMSKAYIKYTMERSKNVVCYLYRRFFK